MRFYFYDEDKQPITTHLNGCNNAGSGAWLLDEDGARQDGYRSEIYRFGKDLEDIKITLSDFPDHEKVRIKEWFPANNDPAKGQLATNWFWLVSEDHFAE